MLPMLRITGRFMVLRMLMFFRTAFEASFRRLWRFAFGARRERISSRAAVYMTHVCTATFSALSKSHLFFAFLFSTRSRSFTESTSCWCCMESPNSCGRRRRRKNSILRRSTRWRKYFFAVGIREGWEVSLGFWIKRLQETSNLTVNWSVFLVLGTRSTSILCHSLHWL